MIEGGCFCGAVRYRVAGGLCDARACHCSRCRRIFGGASSAYAVLRPGSSFEWLQGSEQLTRFLGKDNWGFAFCRLCGSTLCGLHGDEVHGVTLGCVDGDPGVQIEQHLFVASKAPWDHIGGSAPQYPEHPPQPG